MVACPSKGSIIYIDFDPSAGAEIRKRRPALVVSDNTLAKTSPFVWVVPISHGTFNGPDYPLHVKLDNRTKTDGTIYVEQLKVMDYKRRKWSFIEQVPPSILDEVHQKIKLIVK